MNARAMYSVVSHAVWSDGIARDDVLIRDENLGGVTVTNDADAVVKQLVRDRILEPGHRLFYRDTDGRVDEIVWGLDHRGVAVFLNFAPGPGPSAHQEVEAVPVSDRLCGDDHAAWQCDESCVELARRAAKRRPS